MPTPTNMLTNMPSPVETPTKAPPRPGALPAKQPSPDWNPDRRLEPDKICPMQKRRVVKRIEEDIP